MPNCLNTSFKKLTIMYDQLLKTYSLKRNNINSLHWFKVIIILGVVL
jgi:hypothetical protein